MARTWILTGSPENHAATREHGFTVIGLKERNRNRAAEIEPGRFPTSSEVVLEEPEWVTGESVVDDLEHIRKWPREHWKLAFQGQIRTVSDHDGEVLMDRMGAAVGARS